MKSLYEIISESSVEINQKDDPGKKQFIDMIESTGLDIIMGNDVHPNTSDNEFNIKIEELQNAWYDIIHHLEKQGFIRINGIKVNKILNT